MSLEKFIARNKPVKIWIIRQRPNKDPKFHKYEIFEGVGKFFIGLIIFVIIRYFHRSYI